MFLSVALELDGDESKLLLTLYAHYEYGFSEYTVQVEAGGMASRFNIILPKGEIAKGDFFLIFIFHISFLFFIFQFFVLHYSFFILSIHSFIFFISATFTLLIFLSKYQI